MHSNDLDLQQALDVAVDAARRAGGILRHMLPFAVVREKSANDLVTDADIAAQRAIAQVLLGAFPDHAFIGEEEGVGQLPTDSGSTQTKTVEELKTGEESQWTWVVDPLDGTTNFAHGLNNFAVSIGLTKRREAMLGVVYDPMADELFTAIRGRGAWLNATRLRTSGCTEVSRALVAASFPPKMHRDAPEIHQFLNVLLASQSVRRLGSAALNLCYVGAGRLDGYWGGRLNAWDIVAGALVATEAGATVVRHDGTSFDPWGGQVLAAATDQLSRGLRDCLESPMRNG
jgi:myo-inositol-1(or 4)-monophosphatase